MSDLEFRSVIEKRVWEVLQTTLVALTEGQALRLADRLVDTFEINERPAISDEELGRMVVFAHTGMWPPISEVLAVRGGRLRDVLESHGLEIVRKEAGE